ncbi:MAG: hypothetical protein CMJ75_00475 [Planctomycetaceae bacterium]|nr:hypothetical protein [Planctomycetaceae bacterium]
MNDSASGQQPASSDQGIERPPVTIPGILRRLGPGLIIAGSIVGSGELIATTAVGAEAGFVLMWLILIGCVIKVFVQVEFGRYSVAGGGTTMDGLAQVPGPRVSGRGNWIVWYWFVMFLFSLAQLGGIVGGVGQALSISAPMTDYAASYNAYVELETQLHVTHAELSMVERRAAAGEELGQRADELRKEVYRLESRRLPALETIKQKEVSRSGEDNQDLQNELKAIGTARERFDGFPKYSPQLGTFVARLRPLAMKRAALTAAQAASQADPLSTTAKEDVEQLKASSAELGRAVSQAEADLSLQGVVDDYLSMRNVRKPPAPLDDKWWATIITAATVVTLVVGRYGLIQSFSTAMVGAFTLITIVNLLMLQSSPAWGVSLENIIEGIRFRLPEAPPGSGVNPVATALGAFGIIGVGASELIIYPYWCLEKGYARFTGPRNESPEWAERAKGWMRVMRWDAWCSMVVYTFATIAFYLLGAAVLNRTNLNPAGSEMIRYLSVMYRPVFGEVAQLMFLFGAFAVLYSTFFVANASLARVFSDVLRVLGFAASDDSAHVWRVRLLCALLPIACVTFYWLGVEPKAAVLISGIMQSIMLPMLAGAALFFRYRRCDARVQPGSLWDVFLWISAVVMLMTGLWAAYQKLM